MINPGSAPLDDTSEELAAANVEVLLAAARERGAVLGEPVRDPAADRDGRYGWDLPAADGTVVRLLMPGVELTRIRDDISAQAPCLYLNGGAWWWPDAVGLLASRVRWGSAPGAQ
ncbi:hypothetical protein [Actinoplanes sp. NPDC049118]|uniref:hypothetical protein n=1 Tax=Actinoplanes sp. NPDC049118 TaxID=3155769 RepID=UPI0033EADEBD